MEHTILFTNDAVVGSCLFSYAVAANVLHSLIFVKLSTLVCLHLLTCHLLAICKWLKHSVLSLAELIGSVREINVAETDRVIQARQLGKKSYPGNVDRPGQ